MGLKALKVVVAGFGLEWSAEPKYVYRHKTIGGDVVEATRASDGASVYVHRTGDGGWTAQGDRSMKRCRSRNAARRRAFKIYDRSLK